MALLVCYTGILVLIKLHHNINVTLYAFRMYQYYTDAKPGKNGENLQYRELTVLQKMILYHQVKLKESGEEIDAATGKC